MTSCDQIRVVADNYEEIGKKWYLSRECLTDMVHYPMLTNELLIKIDDPFEVHATIENFDDESGIWRAHLVFAKPGNYEPGSIKLNRDDVGFENYAVFADQGIVFEANGRSLEIATGGLGKAATDPDSMDMITKEAVGEKLPLGNLICTCASLKQNDGGEVELIDFIIAFTGKLGYMKSRIPELVEILTGKAPEKKNIKNME